MADVTIGARLELDANDGINSLKQLKGQIKEAQAELLGMQEKFGATSKEAFAAAKKVAELRDRMKEANEVADLFDPGNKFKAIGNAVNALTGGFTALTGAMGLLGVESEEVQKQLLKVQSALALSQGLSQISDSAKDFARLKDIIINTFGKGGAIGIAIAGVAAFGLVILDAINKNRELEQAQKEYNKALVSARIEVAQIQNAFENAKLGLISKDEALKKYNDTLGKTVGEAKNLNEAEKLTAENAQNYIEVQALKAQANYLLQKSAEASAKAEIKRLEIQESAGNSSLLKNFFETINEVKESDIKEQSDKYAEVIKRITGQIAEKSKGFRLPITQPTTKKDKQEQYVFVEATIDELVKLEADGIQKSLKNRFLATEQVEQIRANDYQSSSGYIQAGILAEENSFNAKKKYIEAERDLRIQAAQQVGTALGALADIVGKQTAAGKVLALAQIGIDTAVAISGAVRQASKNPLNLTGFAFVADMAARIGAIIANIAKAKQLLSSSNTNVSTSGTSFNQPAPIQATLPQAQQTLLDQQRLNQQGNAGIRAFVVESDVTNNQDRIRRLNRAARL